MRESLSVSSSSGRTRVYVFGPYGLEYPNGLLFFRGNPVSIQPRQLAVLHLLLESRGNVVTKEEMIRVVWQDAHIEDSNITKAVAEIRRILRPGFQHLDPIRTVWKQGYRFDVPIEVRETPTSTVETKPETRGVAEPVVDLAQQPSVQAQAVVENPPATEKAAVENETRNRRWRVVAACALVVLGLAGPWLARNWPRDNTRFSAAVLGLRNISKDRAASDWIATAVAETLSTELETGSNLRVVPTGDVAHMRSDLGLTSGVEYDTAALRRVRGLLQCRWAVTGSYLVAGKALRLDLQVRDTQSGDLKSVVSETGDQDHLLDLVSRVGERVRLAMGSTPTRGQDGTRTEADAEPLRLYSRGLDALRAWDTTKAQESLSAAALLAPHYAPIHVALSEVWALMGFDRKARDEAQLALTWKAGLPREQQLRIEARYAETSADWPKAIEIWRALRVVYPLQSEYPERLASTLRSGGKAVESVAMLRNMHSKEPGLLLAEAYGSLALADFAAAVAAATAAIDAAHARSASLLEERALDARGNAFSHLSQFERSHEDFQAAQRIAAAIGDQGGRARALLDEGDSFRMHNKLKEARPRLEQAMETAQAIGDRQTVVRCLLVLGNVDRSSADPAGAKRRFEAALSGAHEIGNDALESAAQLNLGNILLNTGDPQGARKNYYEAYQRAKETGDRNMVHLALGNTATVDYFAGKLSLAKSEFEEALAITRQIGERQSSTYKLVYLGRIAISAGDLASAHRYLDEATAILKALNEPVTEPVIWQGALAIAEGHPEAAETPLWALGGKSTRPGPGTKALIVLAESRLVRGELAKARQAADQAAALSAKSPNRADYGLPADLISARIAIADGKYANAGSQLPALLQEARKLQNIPHEFTARLAMAELAARTGNHAMASSTLRELQADARRMGFGSISLASIRLAGDRNAGISTDPSRE